MLGIVLSTVGIVESEATKSLTLGIAEELDVR